MRERIGRFVWGASFIPRNDMKKWFCRKLRGAGLRYTTHPLWWKLFPFKQTGAKGNFKLALYNSPSSWKAMLPFFTSPLVLFPFLPPPHTLPPIFKPIQHLLFNFSKNVPKTKRKEKRGSDSFQFISLLRRNTNPIVPSVRNKLPSDVTCLPYDYSRNISILISFKRAKYICIDINL